MSFSLFHPAFKSKPFWWESYEPKPIELDDVPSKTRVAIIGAGYAGLACALELSKHRIEAVVLDAEMPGFGASARNGGMVSSGVSIGKRYSGKNEPEELLALYSDAADSFSLIEDLIAEEGIDCEWKKTGRFVGAWCQKHFEEMRNKIGLLNEGAEAGAYILPRERQREEIGSDYYHGGMIVMRSGHLQPALYFKGLLGAVKKRGVTICAKAPVTALNQANGGWRLTTSRGTMQASEIVVCTNGYTGPVTPALQRRIVPVGSYIIATEELPEEVAEGLIPKDKSIYDTRRVLTYYRMSGDRKRLIFGGRARFGQHAPEEAAPLLYRFMCDRFPQLEGCRITHAWSGNVAFTFDEVPHMGRLDGLHYALGCNGSGVAMMTYLGTMSARKIAGVANYHCAFDKQEFPTNPFYHGNPWFIPLVGRYFRVRDWIDRHFL
ncbi:MAG TPA: FAD-dependent oxidoreductase [Aestuariivirgaceae bacterium]|jgi:glycine/D-amino acid oxidase-like deaminating enzyme